MNKILLINSFGIGDVLFTTPVISNLRRACPNARIVYIGNRRTAQFLEHNPKIDRVLVYERDEFYAAYQRNPIAFFREWLDFIREIKTEQFDGVFDFSLNSTFGFLGWWCGIPKRIGYDYRGRGRFLTRKIILEGYEGRHVIEYYLDLLRHAGIDVIDTRMELPVTAQDEEWARQWFKGQGIDFNKTLVAVVPGGGASWGAQAKNKRWPAEKYADLTDKIIADSGAAVILMGDAGEERLCQEIARLAHLPLYSAAGQTTLMQMAALLGRCRLAIVNDGGPLHVAVAAGIKTVSIFGPVDAAVYGPYPLEGHRVVYKGLACQPCYRRFRQAQCGHLSCLRDLSVEDVYRKVCLSL
ncbi:MAG: glycosyltransferase family 9 protein [Candidatus Omnitrophica bacterium]|nr:glycosyltransferase family 9 protein [Candidatus Omnitrophota bacterium]